MKNKTPLTPETTMIYAQQKEIEMLNFRIGGFLDWEKNKKKHTNKKYLARH